MVPPVTVDLDVQYACHTDPVPSPKQFRGWVEAVLRGRREVAELTIRIVDAAEGEALNQRWRAKPYPTNVLSFYADGVAAFVPQLLGDIVLCAPVIQREAKEQGKEPLAHWAHITVHGTLHLLGFDHANEAEAETMESLEKEILASLGYADPYAVAVSA